MPYSIKMDGEKHCVVGPSGKKMGCHPSHDEAMKQMQALHANEAMSQMLWVDPFAYVKGQPFRVFPIGDFKRDGREINLTAERLQRIAKNYNDGNPRWKIPIYPGHPTDANPDPAKVGNAMRLEFRENDGLYAHPEYTEDGEKSIESGGYQYVSPGIIWSGYTDEQGNEIPDVLDHIALTNRPFFSNRTALFSSSEALMRDDPFYELKEWFKETFKSEATPPKPVEVPPPKGQPVTLPTDTFDAKAQVDLLTATIKAQKDEYDAKLKVIETEKAEFAAQLSVERKTRELIELKREAQTFTHLPIKADEYAEKFYALSVVNADLAKWFRDKFVIFENLMAQGNLFGQFSRDNASEAQGENLETLTAKILAEEFKGDQAKYADAFVQAGIRRPDLVPAELRSRNPRR